MEMFIETRLMLLAKLSTCYVPRSNYIMELEEDANGQSD